MAIAYVGGQTAGRTNPSSALSVNFALTGGLAATPAAGDLVIVTCVTGSAGGNPAMAVTTPNDYTALGQLNQSAQTADTSMNVSYKFMGGTPDTAVTIPGTGNNAFAEAYAIQVFRGVSQSTPMDATPVSGGGTGTGRPDPASISPVTAGAWPVICGGGAAGTGANYTAPANYTTNFVTSSGADTTDAMVGCGYRSDWTSGAENPAAYTGGTTNATDSWCSYTLALRPAPADQGVTGSAISSGSSLFAATVAYALTTAAIASALTLSTPTVTQNVVSATISSGTSISAPSVTPVVSGATIDSGSSLSAATVEPGAVAVASATIPAGATLNVSSTAYSVDGGGISAGSNPLTPAVAYAVSGSAISSGSAVAAPESSYGIDGAHQASGASLFVPSTTYPVEAAAIAGGSSLAAPLVVQDGGELFIVGATIASGALFDTPSCAYALTGPMASSSVALLVPDAAYVIAGEYQASSITLYTPSAGGSEDQEVQGATISSTAELNVSGFFLGFMECDFTPWINDMEISVEVREVTLEEG